MQKTLSFLITLVLLIGFTACGTPTQTTSLAVIETAPVVSQSATETPGVVVFTDAVLEAKVREEMGRLDGPISQKDADEILELDLSNKTTNNLSEDQMITDISSLCSFRNLFRLDLMSNSIEDISALADLIGLRMLDLSHNQIEDLSPLSGLNLTELMLKDNAITDISALTNMKQLRTLALDSNQISSINGLSNSNKLQNLTLADNPISDYHPLDVIYANLEIKDFEILSDEDVITFTDPVLEAMIRKTMGKPIGDITVAEAKTVNMMDLSMEENAMGDRIHDISSLKYFTNLTELYLNWAFYNNGEPMDISALSHLKNLKILALKGCGVVDISPLEGLSAMESLELQLNGIEDISPLAGLTHLEILSICSNPFQDLSPLGNLTSLKALFLFDVHLSDISVLAGLLNLEMLDLTNTGITDVSPLSNLTKLRMLNLRGNPIEDFSPLNEIYPHLENKDF
ncbi:MAG: leucine-rich repeat domain-containing protein [Anaerolineaceae bacterium]